MRVEEPIDASAEPPGEGPVSSRRTRQLAEHYGVAVVAVGLALLLQWLLFPLFGVEANASPFMMFFAAVMVAAWFGGLGSGLLATSCSALLSWYFFLSPQHPFAIATLGQGLRIIVFTLEGALISLLAGAMQSARRQAEASAQRTVKNQRKLFHNEERLRLALESAGLGTWDYDPASGEVRADDYAKAVLGVPPEAEVNYETFLARIHPYDRERVEELVRRTTDVKNGGEYEVQYRTLGPEDGGAERWMEARGRAFFDKAGRAVRLVGTVLDVTERKRAEQEVRARARQQDAIAELGQRALSTTDLQSLFNDAVKSVAGVLEVEYAKVLELLPGGEELLVRAGVGWKQDIVGRARVSCSRESWAGYTLLTEEPVIVSDLRSETRFAGAPLLHEHGVVSGMTAIINPGGRPFGVLGAHTTERKQYTEDDANFLRAAANVLAAAIQRNQAEEAQRFLAEVGASLSSSLDYRTTLTSMARLVVPTLADWCAIDLLSEDGSAERLAVEHQDRERVPLALRLQERYPHDPNATSGVPNVPRTGCPEFYPEITDEMLQAAARDEEHLMLLRKIGFTSAVIVPMVARGRTLGALTWVSSESGRRYAESDRELAEELARRAALTIDNARLYEEAQRELAEREWAQAELRSSRDELEVILGGIADGVTAQDRTGRVIYANEAAARMVGYPSGRAFMEAAPHEMMERFQVLDEEGYPFPLEDLPGRRALRGQEGAEEVLRFRMLATGEERWALIKALPVFDERGEVRMAVNIFRDITERKRTEDALREMREAERRRIARDLHDSVLQDLSYTAAAIGLIKRKYESAGLQEELQRVIEAVRRAAQGLRHAVNDLRLEGERDRPFPELVESLVQRNRAMARGDYEITLKMGEGLPSVSLGDTGTQLLRVIQEALTNARRHSGARSVSVALRMEGSELVTEVSDDGRGFGAETPPGVGLSSMRERAAAIGGRLEIESEEGQGTRVRLRVPVL